MERNTEAHLCETMSFSVLHLDVYPVGKDILALLYGGSTPHIGCAVLAVPRFSLRGDGRISCTSSVLNVTGHKDEILCRKAAEYICSRYGAVVTCTGGFHQDHITGVQIREVTEALSSLLQRL